MPSITTSQGTVFITGARSAQNSVLTPRYELAIPPDHGFAAWNYDPAGVTNSVAPTAGTVYGRRVWTPKPFTIASVSLLLNVAASGGSPANCWVGVFNSSGTRIGLSADQTTPWGTLGNRLKTIAITADSGQSLAVTGGENQYVIVAHMVGTAATTPAQFASRSQGVGQVVNAGLLDSGGTNTTFRSGVTARTFVIATSASSIPTSFTIDPITGIQGTGNDFWCALTAA